MAGYVGGTNTGMWTAAPKREDAPKPYKVTVSRRFLVLSFASCLLVSFTVGRAARLILIEGPRNALLAPHELSSMRNRPDYHEGHFVGHRKKSLPPPILMEGKKVPRTVYTSKNFDITASATSSSLLVERNGNSDMSSGGSKEQREKDWTICPTEENGTKQCSRGKGGLPQTEDDDDDDDNEEEHLPAGQHLLVDIKNVDGEFLNSEERLAQALVDVVSESRLTLLSYHCHSLVPTGVSCVGVLLESHISFHTWPDEGVITLDLFTCGSNPLLPVVPIIERLFGVPRVQGLAGDILEQPIMIWAHKLRGFRPHRGEGRTNYLETYDMSRSLLGIMDLDMKKEIASVETEFQRIDVYDVIEPRFCSLAAYQRSLADDGSYESLHPEFFFPDRRLYLDGVMQSTKYGDESYHEALVQPGMFAHPNPKRVAIIGGGEGATLREVLKHNTVTKAVMVEIDEMMVNVSREHLPSWSDCSDLIGSAPWCVEDPRSDVYYEDALAWFIDRFIDDDDGDEEDDSSEDDEELDNADPFDVIIMDALDPQDKVPFTEALYNNDKFMRALYNGLTDDGIVVMQLGESPYSDEPSEMNSRHVTRAKLTELLERVGFQSLHAYEEAHSNFFGPWSYMVAFKDYRTRTNWYKNVAEVELAIQKRLMRTHSGSSPLKYFDGATMMVYQAPPKPFEAVYCRNEPMPEECLDYRGFHPDQLNARISSFEVRKSQISDGAGRGVFSTVAIQKDTTLAAEESIHFVHFPPLTTGLISGLYEVLEAAASLKGVFAYMHGYGCMLQILGDAEIYVDSSILTFVNHGCNGTYNMGSEIWNITEFTADPENMRKDLLNKKVSTFNPVIDRHLRFFSAGPHTALRDIHPGEEILDNYLAFVGDEKDWKDYVLELRDQCSGKKIGEVSEYEAEDKM